MTSSRPVYPRAPPAGALEIWILGNHHMAALLADKPARALQHRPEVVTQHAIWASNSFVSHFGLSALSPPGINLAIRSGRRASYRARVPQREPFRANALAVPRPIYPQTPIGGISRTPRRRHRTAGSPSPENLQAHSLASGLSLLLLPSCTQLLRARRLHWGLGCSVSQRNTFAFPARRTRGLSQPGYDDEQGADHADEDPRSETDPHPLFGRPVFPDHFRSRS